MLKLKHGQLAQSLEDLEQLLQPILTGQVPEAAVDTETTEVVGDRFTSFGSPTRIAGFSVSYDLGSRAVDFYAPVRHSPYDWRKEPERLVRDTKHNGEKWLKQLLEVERVLPPEHGGGWAEGADPNLELGAVIDLWRTMFSTDGVTWLAHNWPFDAKMFEADIGKEWLPWERMECTQAWSTFTDPRPLDLWDQKRNEGKGAYVHGGHGLKHLGEAHLGVPADAQKELDEARGALNDRGGKLDDFSMLPLRTALAPYACMDTRLVLKLANHVRKRAAWKLPKVRELLEQHKLERRIFVDMERLGMPVNAPLARERAGAKEHEVHQLVGRASGIADLSSPLKLNDGKGLAVQLYDMLGLPQYRGRKDTRGATLKRVKAMLVEGRMPASGNLPPDQGADLLDAILDYRKAHKELTAFYRPLTHLGASGRIHTVLRPLHAKTTRAAAEKPNTMQMTKPKKGKTPEETRENQVACVRHLYPPEPGRVFLTLDYSGQEMRLGAHYAVVTPPAFDRRFTWRCTLAKRGGRPGDCKGRPPHGNPKDIDLCREVFHSAFRPEYLEKPSPMGLVDGFLSGDKDFDPHQAMVTEVERHSIDIDRDSGKTADFILLFGGGVGVLGDELDCEASVARQISDLFWHNAYPELYYVRQFVDERLRNVGKAGQWSHQPYLLTLHGAPIHLADGFKGLNYLTQRGCREILLKALLRVDEYLTARAPDYKLMLPVHDELILDAPKDLDQKVVGDIARIMVSAGAACRIPMVVEPSVCHESWAIKDKLGDGWGWDGVNQGVETMEELMSCLI